MAQRIQGRNGQLKSVKREVEAFNAAVAHDLRAPLRHIEGYVNLLLKKEQEKLDEESQNYLSKISKTATGMNRLIDSLLSLFDIERAEIKRECIKMNSLVTEIKNELTAHEDIRSLKWRVHFLPDALGDINLIRQVWRNILSNALKFTANIENTFIEIGIIAESNPENTKDKDVITYFIRDNGVGFDPNYISKLFQPCQRLHAKSEFPGNGIGLSIVKHIIDRHGGEIWAEGATNKGASFFFTLQKAKAN